MCDLTLKVVVSNGTDGGLSALFFNDSTRFTMNAKYALDYFDLAFACAKKMPCKKVGNVTVLGDTTYIRILDTLIQIPSKYCVDAFLGAFNIVGSLSIGQ